MTGSMAFHSRSTALRESYRSFPAAFFRVLSVLPQSLARHPGLKGIERLEPSPISSIHLWFDRPITELPHAAFVDRLCQWMFNRTAIGAIEGSQTRPAKPDEARPDGAHYYQIVISASRRLEGRHKDDIQREVLQELTEIWPAVADTKLLHSRQVTEHRAVFSPVPGVDAWRPVQQSPVANLQFAGDWTRTGWPSTMEGAVRSGYLAVENILQRLGRPETVVQANLKTSLLSRWMFGL